MAFSPSHRQETKTIRWVYTIQPEEFNNGSHGGAEILAVLPQQQKPYSGCLSSSSWKIPAGLLFSSPRWKPREGSVSLSEEISCGSGRVGELVSENESHVSKIVKPSNMSELTANRLTAGKG